MRRLRRSLPCACSSKRSYTWRVRAAVCIRAGGCWRSIFRRNGGSALRQRDRESPPLCIRQVPPVVNECDHEERATKQQERAPRQREDGGNDSIGNGEIVCHFLSRISF